MTFRYDAVIVKEGRGYWAYLPDLPGVYGVGRTPAAAKKDLKEALQLYLEVCREDGELPPRPLHRVVDMGEVTATV
ncbi:MAG: type II toxin-antitoxin system HicB family antitoxin [Elusimicrobia bacterium]|nr:type II toxin-antitoxin system HicB family antitoxin [Elusimicrobiota bacterium]